MAEKSLDHGHVNADAPAALGFGRAAERRANGAAPGLRSAGWLVLRLAVLAGLLSCLLGPPATALMQALLPVQRATFAMLMPDFVPPSLTLDPQGAHLKLRAQVTNRRYVVLAGQVAEPGTEFTVETPARTGLLLVALALGAVTLLVPWQRKPLFRVLTVCLPAAAVFAVLPAVLILTGQLWGLGVSPLSEFSVEAGLVALSRFLLHGGGYALCAAAVALALARARA